MTYLVPLEAYSVTLKSLELIDDLLLASSLPHPMWKMNNSKWASRGWTYQEGLLSNGVLFSRINRCFTTAMACTAVKP